MFFLLFALAWTSNFEFSKDALVESYKAYEQSAVDENVPRRGLKKSMILFLLGKSFIGQTYDKFPESINRRAYITGTRQGMNHTGW